MIHKYVHRIDPFILAALPFHLELSIILASCIGRRAFLSQAMQDIRQLPNIRSKYQFMAIEMLK